MIHQDKKIYINEGDELKVLDYGIESLPFLLNTARERFDVMLREGNLTLNKYIDLPKKFLKVLMESLEINSNVIKIQLLNTASSGIYYLKAVSVEGFNYFSKLIIN